MARARGFVTQELKLLFVEKHVVGGRPLNDLVEICLGLNHITDRVYSASNSGVISEGTLKEGLFDY